MQRHRRIRNKGIQLIQGRMRTILTVAGVGIALLLLILVLRPTTQLMNSPEIARARRVGVLRVGVRTDAPGFGCDGQGLEIELARALCERLFPDMDAGIMLELVPVTQYTALAKLNTGDIDVTFSLQWNKKESSYAYSEPYYYDTVCILCRPEDVNTPLDNKKVGIIAGTTTEAAFTAFGLRGEEQISSLAYASYPDMLLLLKNKTLDYVAAPGALVPQLLEEEGVALHKDNIGAVGYVAVSLAESPAFAMLADLMIEELSTDGRLNAWIAENGLTMYQYQQ